MDGYNGVYSVYSNHGNVVAGFWNLALVFGHVLTLYSYKWIIYHWATVHDIIIFYVSVLLEKTYISMCRPSQQKRQAPYGKVMAKLPFLIFAAGDDKSPVYGKKRILPNRNFYSEIYCKNGDFFFFIIIICLGCRISKGYILQNFTQFSCMHRC